MEMRGKIQWYHSPLKKEDLIKLTKRSDTKAFLQVLSQILITALLFFISYYSFRNFPIYVTIPLFFIYATIFSFMGLSGAGHELSHRTVFKTKFWNEFFIRCFGFLSWTNFHFFRTSHVRHHQFTVHKHLDLEVVLPMKILPFEWLFQLTFNFRGFKNELTTLIRHCFGIVKGEWEERIYPENNIKERHLLFRWARIVLVGHVLLAIVFVITGEWPLLFLITFAHFFAQWINFLFTFTQHAGLQPNVPDFRLCCRSVKLNPLFSFFYWQMNYHVEHHSYAAVPFYNLKRLRNVIGHDLPEAKSLFPAWKEISLALKEQKTNPEYYYNPVLPQ